MFLRGIADRGGERGENGNSLLSVLAYLSLYRI
jgi:hypothetical protein